MRVMSAMSDDIGCACQAAAAEAVIERSSPVNPDEGGDNRQWRRR